MKLVEIAVCRERKQMLLRERLLSRVLILNKVDVGWLICLKLIVILVHWCFEVQISSRLFHVRRFAWLLVVLLMNCKVALQVSGLRKLLMTHGAGVWSLASMNTHMLLQSGGVTESTGAHFALVGLFLCVGTQMNQGISRVAKCFD